MFSKEIIANSDNKSLLSMTEYAQPAILTHSIAMLKVLEQECGIYSNSAAVKDNDPTVALGHSLGEYSALVATGSIALPDAARLVRLRGRLMQTAVPSGTKTAMAALMPANREVIESLISEVCHDLGQICAIANVNSKHQIVISGTEGAVREVANRARKVRATRRVISLDVSSAFHSPLMFPALPQLEEALHNTDIKIPAIPIIFNATGMLSTKSEEEIRKLLLLQLTSPVLWLESMHTARDVCKCPNDCSGHGTCNVYSACECYRNWQAADCSERVCYFGHAFVDTPQGDLNSDGRLDIRSNAFHVVLGSADSFTKNDSDAVVSNLLYQGRDADGTVKSSFHLNDNGIEYAVEDDITQEYEINVSDTYGYSEACNDKLKTAGPTAPSNSQVVIKYTIAFEVTGVEEDVVSVTATNDVTCAAGAEVKVYTTAPTDASECNANESIGVIAKASTTKEVTLKLYPGAHKWIDSLVPTTAGLTCSCDALVDLGAVATVNAMFPSRAVPQCRNLDASHSGYDMAPNTMACESTSVSKFKGVCLDVNGSGAQECIGGGAANTKTSGVKVCSITPALYEVQWSNQKEWEVFPSEHGVAGSKLKSSWDEGHFYRECSNKGICNRGTGLCECFAGYEGEGCTRTKCLNDCSGHGKCRRAVDVDSSYVAWDAYKSQQCQCDGGYTGVDCSLRVCPSGDDPVTRMADKNERQTFRVAERSAIKTTPGGGTAAQEAYFALEFTTELGEKFTTRSIDFLHADVASHVERALEGLPNNVIEDVEVSVDDTYNSNAGRAVSVTFLHNSGDIPVLGARYNWHYKEGAGTYQQSRNKADGSFSTKGLVIVTDEDGEKENAICSNRGVCDYTTGLCKCFGGFTDFDCSVQNALATA
eukprot:g5430.t1